MARPQEINSFETLTVEIVDEQRGGPVLRVDIAHDGPKSLSYGKLIIECGDGQRIELANPLRFLDEIWCNGLTEGMKRAKAE